MELSRRTIIFDTGPIITFAITALLSKIVKLKDFYQGDFILPTSVERELVDRPLATKKFRLEALQVLHYIQGGTFKVYNTEKTNTLTKEILGIANSTFKAKGNWIRIVSHAEVSVFACAIELGSSTVVIDERTMRLLIEEPNKIREILEKKLHTKVEADEQKINLIKEMSKGIEVIRSAELAMISYELGLLDDYLINSSELHKSGITHHKVKDSETLLLEAVLWALKLNGCSISTKEIEQAVKETKKKK
jgi:hypothetical protein